MPSALVKSYAEKYKTTIDEMEKIWNKAKQIAANKFKLPSPDYITDKRIWAYVTKTFIRIAKNKYSKPVTVSTESIR